MGKGGMKIKTISRCEQDFTRETKDDLQKVFRNYDPKLHPHERAREVTNRSHNADRFLNFSVNSTPVL